MIRTASAACATAIALALGAPALAQERHDVVEYGELDPYSDEGADTLLRRLEDASETYAARSPARCQFHSAWASKSARKKRWMTRSHGSAIRS